MRLCASRLTIQIHDQFPQFGGQVSAVVLAAVIIFGIAGPILARTALLRAGDATAPASSGRGARGQLSS